MLLPNFKYCYRLLPFAVLSGLLGAGLPAHAQNPAMSLIGSVQSDTHAPLTGAAITVVHLPSGVRHAAASDASGRFVVGSLMVGGPYTIKVSEGGYRSQTVDNIFLENGKTANFTVVLNRLGEDNKNRSSKESTGSALTLAPEAVVGGPVLITTTKAPARTPPAGGVAMTTSPAARSAAPARPVAASATAPAPANPGTAPKMTAASAAAPATAMPAPAPVPAEAGTPAPAPRYTSKPRYTRRYSNRVADPIVPGRFDAKTGNYVYDTGASTTLKLANGGSVPNVGVNSTESYLYRFLTNPEMVVDTVNLTQGWYNFDRVFFDAGKATITRESLSQLRNVATIMRAYPDARIKLGGYTDDTGTYKVNRELSEARARTAWASLVEMGISPNRIEARGYGSNYSIASNSTEEGRAQNRRLSLRVLQK